MTRMIVVSFFLMTLVTLLMPLPCTGAEIKKDDTVVTTESASLMDEGKSLLTIAEGKRLLIKQVSDPWVLVTVHHQGKEINGWIQEDYLNVASPFTRKDITPYLVRSKNLANKKKWQEAIDEASKGIEVGLQMA